MHKSTARALILNKFMRHSTLGPARKASWMRLAHLELGRVVRPAKLFSPKPIDFRVNDEAQML